MKVIKNTIKRYLLRRRESKRKFAFTILELILVITIMSITFVFVNYAFRPIQTLRYVFNI